MTEADHLKFQRLMKDFYKSKSERNEKFAYAVLEVAIDLIDKIEDAALEGAEGLEVKRFAGTRIDQLTEALEAFSGGPLSRQQSS